MVLIHRYSIAESRPTSSTVNATQILMLTFVRSISLLIASHLFPSLCCTFSKQHTPPLVKTLPSTKQFRLLQIIPRMHQMPLRLSISTHFSLHSFGCCAMRMLSPLMLPPQLYSTPHTHVHAHSSRSGSKPLRLGSSNLPIKSAPFI